MRFASERRGDDLVHAFDAAVLLVADGLVAVGRVLRGLRWPSGAEVRAQAHVDALNALEDSQDGLEPGQLSGEATYTCGHCHLEIFTNDGGDTWWHGGTGLEICFGDDFEPVIASPGGVRSAAVSTPAADNTTDCGCGSGSKCPDPITCPDAVTAAMDADTAAADGTDLYDAIVALWDYHGVDTSWDDEHPWGCQGCEWKGDYQREHTLHRLALVADMKAATHRIQEQLGGTS